MKRILIVLKRIVTGLMWITFFILVVCQFLWWFIPLLLFGISHKQVIDRYSNFICTYSHGLFERSEYPSCTVDSSNQCTRSDIKCLTVAKRLHDSYIVQSEVMDIISDAFEKYEPDVYEKLEFHISSDEYDNSIEIYFDVSLPYPYEPCKEIRTAIYDLGFSIVYWNFLKDVMDVKCDRITPPPPDNIWKDSPDEIRGWEPRHSRHGIWVSSKYGFVDDRFNQAEWESKYKFHHV